MSQQDVKTKQEISVEFVKGVVYLNSEIKLLQESKKDLKNDYIDRGLLTKEEVKMLNKAISAINSETDIDMFVEAFTMASDAIGGVQNEHRTF